MRISAVLIRSLICLFLSASLVNLAHGANAPSLSGIVSSEEEGRMEGVLVSAKREGSNITVTVVTDAQGRYSFPAERLQPASCDIRTRAAGYDLDDPGVAKLEAGKTTQLDLNRAAGLAFGTKLTLVYTRRTGI